MRSDPVHTTVLSLEGLPAPEGEGAYAGYLLNAFETEWLTERREAELQSFLLGPMTLLTSRCAPRRTSRTQEAILRDGGDAFGVQLVLNGRASGEADGTSFNIGPGDLVFYDLGRPLLVHDEGERADVSLAAPRGLVAQIHPAPERLHGAVFAPPAVDLLGAFLRALPSQLERADAATGAVLGRIVFDLLAILLKTQPLAQPLPEPWPARPEPEDALLARAQAWLNDHLNDSELTPETLAAALNVSRSALYKSFGRYGGVAQYLQRRRLIAVRTALLNPYETRSISELALSAGVSSTPHFARAFRSAFGVTAGQFRRQVQGRADRETSRSAKR